MGVIMRVEMHEEPTPLLKGEKTEEDGAKNFKPKYKAPFILQGGTTLEEPTRNINEEGRRKNIKMGKNILTQNFIK
ncbi:hypothetical protein CWI37_0025p0080 [Hamiltosporidium tvaerminnensis]|uniref:Uncharacterized protein n=1 Tax=Hamiltosporidium tvaerminnensis TaxID=1176355 RepID=A0A4V2JVT3_9MICR|nr:hypothetical protein CWI37_0025p0080 [Hamiltosporidium tvaerminnensis]